MLVETWLFSFFKFYFFVFNKLTFLVILGDLFKEAVLGILICPREAVQDTTTIAAVILCKLNFEDLPKKIVRDSDLLVVNDDFGPAFLRLR